MAFVAALLVGMLAQPPAIAQQTTYVEWTEREYVYTPGYIDEFIAEYDSTGDYWPILQDANFNAVAMTDDTGVVVRQRVYGPYGRLLATENLTSATPPKSRIGHQGLFAERLDAGTLATPLAGGSVLAWHNRNRSLLSEHGRFAQRDPNGTGQGARGELAHAGPPFLASPDDARPIDLFGDGMNVYCYAHASPFQNQDPSGLFVIPGPSDFVTGALESLVTEYSANLEWDVHWSQDWGYSDESHTRGDSSWINIAIGMGLYDSFDVFGFNILDPASDMFYMSKGGGRWSPHMPSYRRFTSRWSAGDVGPYAHLAQKYGDAGQYNWETIGKIIRAENKRMNGGRNVSDVTGLPLSRIAGRPNSPNVDHIQSRKRGGGDAWGNFQLVEAAWNQAKGADLPNVYR